jgi:carbon storage regulator
MFVISRRAGQRVVIGSGIEVVVLESTRTTVRLGISAPEHFPILRGEIADQIEAANREAAASSNVLDTTGVVAVVETAAHLTRRQRPGVKDLSGDGVSARTSSDATPPSPPSPPQDDSTRSST